MTPTHPAQSLAAYPVRSVYQAEQLLALIAIVLLLPVALLIAVTIFVLSRRSPLVRHSRIGQHGSPLALLKFRTMWDGRQSRSPFFSIEDVTANGVPAAKSAPDSRIGGRFALFCRRYSLDELPQLLHVVRGEMSLVGPRPLTAKELITWYGPAAPEVLTLRPGLTGLWQITGRSRLTYPQRKRLDLFLARHHSLGLYALILLRTIPKVIFAEDAC